MKPIRLALIVSGLAVVAGCVAVPVDSGYYGEPRGYYGGYYGPAPAYYVPPYYGPSIGIGIYGGSRSFRDGGRRHYDRDYRRDGRRGDGHRHRDWNR